MNPLTVAVKKGERLKWSGRTPSPRLTPIAATGPIERAEMKVRVGIAVVLVAVTGFLLVKNGSRLAQDAHVVRARFSDVRDLPIGAKVNVAGLPIGEIVERRVGSGYAEVDIEFHTLVDLRDDAILYKRRSSLLSGPILELDPGTDELPLQGRYIKRVNETSPIGEVLYDVSDALPAVRRASEEGMVRAENFRAQVNGPVSDTLREMEEATDSIGMRMHERLASMNEGLKKSENIRYDARASIEPVFKRAEELTDFAREKMSEGRSWVTVNAQETRAKIEDTQIDWSPYAEPIEDIDSGKGTLGELVNNRELADDIEEATRDARSFVDLIVNLQMLVGLRVEYLTTAAAGRTYLTLQAGRPDRYYYLEIVSTPQGAFPDVRVVYDQGLGGWRRDIVIEDGVRFTAQVARRLGPAIFRFGLKESSFGFGTDLSMFDDRLQLSADVYEFGQFDLPRLKLAASYRFFGKLFILAGIDDALNKGQLLPIADNGAEVPKRSLAEIYVGRDYFFGGSLQFNDRDLANLLRIGGDAITSFVL